MDVLVSIFLLIGGSFVLVAAIGLIRLPDLLMRMHAATKAGTLGAGLLLAAVAVTVPGDGVAVKALATVVFLLLTAPIASHVIARSAYHAGDIQLWDRTHVDELAEDLEANRAKHAAQIVAQNAAPNAASYAAERADQRLAPHVSGDNTQPLAEAASRPPTVFV